VRQRAAFELNCAQPLDVIPIVTTEIQAGQQVAKVYVRGDYASGWVLNSSDAAPR
jgi:hypothetical protein